MNQGSTVIRRVCDLRLYLLYTRFTQIRNEYEGLYIICTCTKKKEGELYKQKVRSVRPGLAPGLAPGLNQG